MYKDIEAVSKNYATILLEGGASEQSAEALARQYAEISSAFVQQGVEQSFPLQGVAQAVAIQARQETLGQQVLRQPRRAPLRRPAVRRKKRQAKK